MPDGGGDHLGAGAGGWRLAVGGLAAGVAAGGSSMCRFCCGAVSNCICLHSAFIRSQNAWLEEATAARPEWPSSEEEEEDEYEEEEEDDGEEEEEEGEDEQRGRKAEAGSSSGQEDEGEESEEEEDESNSGSGGEEAGEGEQEKAGEGLSRAVAGLAVGS